MKLFTAGMLAAVLVPVGIVLTALGFWIAFPDARTALQVVGIAALAGGAWQVQRLVNAWQKMLDDA